MFVKLLTIALMENVKEKKTHETKCLTEKKAINYHENCHLNPQELRRKTKKQISNKCKEIDNWLAPMSFHFAQVSFIFVAKKKFSILKMFSLKRKSEDQRVTKRCKRVSIGALQ